jgi:hypothetical protein
MRQILPGEWSFHEEDGKGQTGEGAERLRERGPAGSLQRGGGPPAG